MSTRQEFYITLPSNVKATIENENNTISNYKTFLNQRLEFGREKWSVGLAEISYTRSWYNVRNTEKIAIYNEFGESIEKKNSKPLKISTATIPVPDPQNAEWENFANIEGITIENATIDVSWPKLFTKPGYYNSIDELVNTLNVELSKLNGFMKIIPLIMFDKINHKISIQCGKYNGGIYFPDFGFEIENILGLVNKENRTIREILKEYHVMRLVLGDLVDQKGFEDVVNFFNKQFIEALRPAELNAGCNSLYVYSNIIEHSFVGDAFAQLLRVVEVPSSSSFGELVTIIYNSPHLIPLQTNSFDTIDLDIKDDTGLRIPFEFGRVSIKLILKKND